MGSAWDSFDVFAAMALALNERGDGYLGRVAELRCEEILNAGGGSLHPANRPGAGETADAGIEQREQLRMLRLAMLHDEDEIVAYYARAREGAERWRSERNAFMLTRREAGKHPDTDPAFWKGYTERAAPTPPGTLIPLTEGRRQAAWVLKIVGILLLALLALWVIIKRRQRLRRVVAS